MRIIRRVTIAIACVGMLGVTCVVLFPSVRLFIGMALIGLGDPSWRPIADSNGLVADCRLLLAEMDQNGEEYSWAGYVRIPHERWSPRIRELSPTQVRVDRQACNLLFHNQFQNLTWGYAVYPAVGTEMPRPCDRPHACGDRYVWPTADQRILRWESTVG